MHLYYIVVLCSQLIHNCVIDKIILKLAQRKVVLCHVIFIRWWTSSFHNLQFACYRLYSECSVQTSCLLRNEIRTDIQNITDAEFE